MNIPFGKNDFNIIKIHIKKRNNNKINIRILEVDGEQLLLNMQSAYLFLLFITIIWSEFLKKISKLFFQWKT